MLTIDLGTMEYYDGSKNEFAYDIGGIVRFEYSLKTIYDWEAKWKKPFLNSEKTSEEMLDFYMMMALDPIKESFMTTEVMKQLSDYMSDTHTATTFSTSDDNQNGNKTPSIGKVYTAEELYAMMITANVPIEFESRNLNRLLVILRIISSYNSPPKKMSRDEIYRQNAELNRQRKAQMKSRG